MSVVGVLQVNELKNDLKNVLRWKNKMLWSSSVIFVIFYLMLLRCLLFFMFDLWVLSDESVKYAMDHK